MYISINKSNIQSEDIEIINDNNYDNLKLIVQEKLLSAKEHAIKIFETINIVDDEFYLFLCHDDLLNSDGLNELLNKSLGNNEAFFGSQSYFSDNKEIININVSELLFYKNGIEPINLALIDLDKYFAFNLSGLVINGSVLKKVFGFKEN